MIVAGVTYNPINQRDVSGPSAARAASSTKAPARSRAARSWWRRASWPPASRSWAGRATHLPEGTAPDRLRVSGVRRFGSAALDLAYVAAGRFDATGAGLANGLAAGLLFIPSRAAGGLRRRRRERPAADGTICVANSELHPLICLERIRALIRRSGSDHPVTDEFPVRQQAYGRAELVRQGDAADRAASIRAERLQQHAFGSSVSRR